MSKSEEEEIPEVLTMPMPQIALDFAGTELYGDLHGQEAQERAEEMFNTPTSGRWTVAKEKAAKVASAAVEHAQQGGQVPEVVARLGLVLGGVLLAYGVYRVTSSLIKRMHAI